MTWRRASTLILVILMSAATTACGTRADQTGSPSPSAPLAPLADEGAAGNEHATPASPQLSSDTVPSDVQNGPSKPTADARPSAPDAAGSATQTTRANNGGAATSATSTPRAAAPTGKDGRTRAAPTPAPGPATGKKTPIRIASVGTLAGPAGAVFLPSVQALQAWVAYTNARGGLSGHPVQLFVYDDGGDAARHRSQVQEAVEQRKVVAFVQNNEALSGQGSVEYLTKKRVPVIGNDTGTVHGFYESPMYFPQAGTGLSMYAGFVYGPASQMISAGKTKLGTVVCVEGPPCTVLDGAIADSAPKAGFQHVYRGRASFTQPDYTSECLTARGQGVQVILIALDTNSVIRLANSCARQGYRPIFATGVSIVADRLKVDPNLEGMVAATNVFPYFQSGTPATDEFHRVMKEFGGKGITLGVGPATGWVSAKLFEKAAAASPEPPTSEAILRGLWGIKNDDLGGLTQPLTFNEDQPAPRMICWFNLLVRDRAWTSPDNAKLRCA